MKFIQILFSTPMVEAILDGRKTKTRRTKGLDFVNEFPDYYKWLDQYEQMDIHLQPHPYAIFKDKPTRFIEVYRHHSMGLVVNSPNLISRLEYCLQNTSICGHQTIALFIIKPRKHPLSPSQWGDRLNQLNKR